MNEKFRERRSVIDDLAMKTKVLNVLDSKV